MCAWCPGMNKAMFCVHDALFSAPELKAQVHYCHHALSVVRLSVCPSLPYTFSTSSLKPLNGIQRNLTGSKISTSSTKFVFFRANWKNKMAALASDWLRHFRLLLWNRWAEFNETWQQARSQCPLPNLCFFGPIEKKQNGHTGFWLAETFSTFPLKLLNGIQPNLRGSKISMSSSNFVFFGPIRKTRWPP